MLCLVCALALIGGSFYAFGLAGMPGYFKRGILAGSLMLGVGMYWLWADIVRPLIGREE